MTKLEKIKNLENIKKTLKEEFIGLDSIIDDIITSVTPWYVTPEVIVKPVIVSLWGMTGTGKSSVVKRLVELLDCKHKTLFFDCGTECNESNYKNLGDEIVEFLDNDHEEYGAIDKNFSKELIYVFDEFQYARTIDSSGEDLLKPNFRPVWNLLDNGIININESSYEVTYFRGFVEDFGLFAKEHPNIRLVNLKLMDQNDVKEYLNTLGYFYYDRGVPNEKDYKAEGYYPKSHGSLKKNEDEDKEDDYEVDLSPLKVLDYRVTRILLKRSEKSIPEITKEFNEIETLGELKDYLEKALKFIQAPKYLDCSKSLIFVVGNLDEAFKVEGDTNPDLDADMYFDLTSKVTVMDIKEALKKRFRAEQIARFGNTMIKYPTLKKEHFIKIINKEVQRICNDFYNDEKIKVNVSENILDLLYSEGVYPVQGVRPALTTVGTIFTPLLSNISIQKEKTGIEKVDIDVIEPEKGYKLNEKSVRLSYSNGQSEIKSIKLHLGELRNPEKRKTRFICSVHELGHAVVSAYVTGNIPELIVSVSADSGGFCMTYDTERENEIPSRKDIQNEVMIGLAGYESELLVYGYENRDRCLMGSENDIESTWDSLANAAYKLGYFLPYEFKNYEVFRSDIPGGMRDKELEEKIKEEFERLRNKTKEIIKGNLKLIKKAALILGNSGSMTGKKFLEIIKETPGNTLNVTRLEVAKKENSYEFYEELLKINVA